MITDHRVARPALEGPFGGEGDAEPGVNVREHQPIAAKDRLRKMHPHTHYERRAAHAWLEAACGPMDAKGCDLRIAR